jgi:hypothetical protein
MGLELSKRERYFEIFMVVGLLAFGVYHSILYFGHTIVPNSDFPSFFRTGQEILSLNIPSSFKRGPVLGILQVFLSKFMGGPHPGLTAGWLINAILHPFSIVLLWLVGKRIVGRSALWVAVIAMINPWVISMLTHPIAETTLLFFVLLTTYLIFKRSNWCYLFASITTMVRYEGAALILAAFVMDMISSKDRKQRIQAFIYAVAATMPLAIWMFGTMVNWQSAGPTHYLRRFSSVSTDGLLKDVLIKSKYIRLIWEVGFSPLFTLTIGSKMFMNASKTLAAISFITDTS